MQKALTEANGDIELAIDNLRKSGQAKAAKKLVTLLLTVQSQSFKKATKQF